MYYRCLFRSRKTHRQNYQSTLDPFVMLKFLAKRLLPTVVSNLFFDVSTVEKADGYYLRVLVQAFGYTLLDEKIKLSSQSSSAMTKNEVLTLEQPVDVTKSNLPDALESLSRIK